MAQTKELYDSTLIGILQNEGQISNFLDALCGFLYRRTDFYRVMKSKTDSLGFPPGVATKMLLTVHRKYEELASDDVKRQENQRVDITDTTPPPAVKIVEVTTEVEKPKTLTTPPTRAVENNQQVQEVSKSAKGINITRDLRDKAIGDSSVQNQHSQMQSFHPDSAGDKPPNNTMDNTDDSEISRQQRIFQDNPESFNGAVRDNYSWSQSITDLDVMVNVPQHVKKGKDVKVDIQRKHVVVSYRSTEGDWVDVVNGDLTWEVHKEECLWSLVPGEHVHVNFDKVEERWWESIFTDEPKINVRKIDASRPMTDLDDEAQAKIEEMMYNERQKRLGLPQSHEKKVHDVLKQAWDAEGSPFKGQDFDPSKFQVDPNGVVSMNPT